MAITITRDLNVVSVGVPPVIHLSQYDSDFTLVFNLYASTGAFTMPTGTTAEIRGTKRDGNGYDAAATVFGSTVTVTGDEQMTAVAGQNVFEIATYYNNKRLNTINFIVDVERAALDADTIASESVLRELNAIIEGAATATAAAESAAADAADASDYADTAEAAALEALASNFSVDVRTALLACFAKVAWIDEHGQSYYDALESAMNPQIVESINAVFTQGNNVVYESDNLNYLRDFLVVTATYSDSSTEVVSGYVLSGTLTEGTSTITVSYAGRTTTFTVNVTWGFILREAESFSGTKSVDTHKSLVDGGTTTVAIKFTVSEVTSPTHFLWNNRVNGGSNYTGLQTVNNWNGSSYHNFLWGVGIGYNAGIDKPVVNHKYAIIATITKSGLSLSASAILRDITASATRSTYSNSYTYEADNTASIKIGASSDLEATKATVHEMVISKGSWTTAQVAAFLEE